MTANNYHSRRHKNFPPRADKEDKKERSPLRWPNYTEDDIEQWITDNGCVWPYRLCEICKCAYTFESVSLDDYAGNCPLFKILIGER